MRQQGMNIDPVSGLLLPTKFIDEKQSLKRSIEEVVEKAVNSMQHVTKNYFLSISAKFDKQDPTVFNIAQPVATFELPPFKNNQLVYWISNSRGIKELLWMVAPAKKGEKLKVEFNKSGVAYLQAKSVMPS